MFYTYNQNNSGGEFVFDEEAGITHYVIIEADDLNKANSNAEKIGIYFNGCDSGIDCPCCGDRWNEPWLEDIEPSIYGTPLTELTDKNLSYLRWMEVGKEVCIHYKNGEKVWM